MVRNTAKSLMVDRTWKTKKTQKQPWLPGSRVHHPHPGDVYRERVGSPPCWSGGGGRLMTLFEWRARTTNQTKAAPASAARRAITGILLPQGRLISSDSHRVKQWCAEKVKATAGFWAPVCQTAKQRWRTSHLGGEVSLRLELLEERGQEEGGKEEDDGPEENIWDVGPVMTTGQALEFPTKLLTNLEKQKGHKGLNWIFSLFLIIFLGEISTKSLFRQQLV